LTLHPRAHILLSQLAQRVVGRNLRPSSREVTMAKLRILVFYGSYRSDRMGIRLANFIVERLGHRNCDVELIDAKAVNLPMLDRMTSC